MCKRTLFCILTSAKRAALLEAGQDVSVPMPKQTAQYEGKKRSMLPGTPVAWAAPAHIARSIKHKNRIHKACSCLVP